MNTNSIKVYQRVVTPEDAQKFLEKNNGNRKLSERNVLFFFHQMKRGDWQLTADPIKFSKTGRLLDGQHRLAALIKNNKPIEMFIAEGLDEKIFTVLDTGKNRSAGDLLSTQGFKNSNALAGAVRSILLYQQGYYSDPGRAARVSKATNTNIIKWIEDNPEIQEILGFTNHVYRQFRYISHGPLTMLYWTLSRKNQEQADNFFGKYASGIELSEGSAIRLLRERLIKDSQNKTKLSSRDKTAIFIYAWNAFVTKKTIERLTLQKNYQFPKPV